MMMRWVAIALLSIYLMATGAVGDTGDGAKIERSIRVTTDVQTDSITVGERFTIRYRAVFPDTLTVVPDGSFEIGNCRLLSLKWSDNYQGGERIREGRLEAMTLDLEQAHVPAFSFKFLTPLRDTVTVFTEDVYIPVRQIVPAEQAEPLPLKPQWEAPRSNLWWIVAAAALVALALALWLWRRRSRKQPVAVAAVELPADLIALRELAEIERSDLLVTGAFKEYYSRITDVLRGYLERRFDFLAMEETTDEILGELERRRISIDGVERLLQEADLVKFAKHVPDAAAGKLVLEAAREIVVRTAPRPLPRPVVDEPATVGE